MIRYLLKQETFLCEHGFSDELEMLCFILYKIGNTEDIELLWEIMNTNFDTYCGLDIQLVAVPNEFEALFFLKGINEDWALAAY